VARQMSFARQRGDGSSQPRGGAESRQRNFPPSRHSP